MLARLRASETKSEVVVGRLVRRAKSVERLDLLEASARLAGRWFFATLRCAWVDSVGWLLAQRDLPHYPPRLLRISLGVSFYGYVAGGYASMSHAESFGLRGPEAIRHMLIGIAGCGAGAIAGLLALPLCLALVGSPLAAALGATVGWLDGVTRARDLRARVPSPRPEPTAGEIVEDLLAGLPHRERQDTLHRMADRFGYAFEQVTESPPAPEPPSPRGLRLVSPKPPRSRP